MYKLNLVESESTYLTEQLTTGNTQKEADSNDDCQKNNQKETDSNDGCPKYRKIYRALTPIRVHSLFKDNDTPHKMHRELDISSNMIIPKKTKHLIKDYHPIVKSSSKNLIVNLHQSNSSFSSINAKKKKIKKKKKKVTFIDKDNVTPLIDVVEIESYKQYNVNEYLGDFNDNYKREKMKIRAKQYCHCNCACLIF